MSISWFETFLVGAADFDERQRQRDAEEFWAQVAQDAILRGRRDRQVWRMTTLLRAALNEKKGKPGDQGRNQGQIRVICEAMYESTMRELSGSFEAMDRLLADAERTKASRDRWFAMSLSPALRRQVELMEKLAAA